MVRPTRSRKQLLPRIMEQAEKEERAEKGQSAATTTTTETSAVSTLAAAAALVDAELRKAPTLEIETGKKKTPSKSPASSSGKSTPCSELILQSQDFNRPNRLTLDDVEDDDDDETYDNDACNDVDDDDDDIDAAYDELSDSDRLFAIMRKQAAAANLVEETSQESDISGKWKIIFSFFQIYIFLL
jgi:hypothetical protein